MHPFSFKVWLAAARPHTLPLAVTSIVTGSALSFGYANFNWLVFFLAISTALLLQILSNFANDYGDLLKGTDNHARLGPKRGLQLGLINKNSMKIAIFINVLMTVGCGLLLLINAFADAKDIFSFCLLGAVAIIAAICYTVGNKAYGYYGLGDAAVLLFFGLLGVLGSFYLQQGFISALYFLPAIACGLLAVCVLNINNLRDIDNDRACNKKTLVVRIGPKNSRIYHLCLLAGIFLFFSIFTFYNAINWFNWIFLLATPLAFRHGKSVWQAKDGAAIRPLMGQVVKLALITNLLFSLPLFVNVSL